MAIAQGGATGTSQKDKATQSYWDNYVKYNQPKAAVTKPIEKTKPTAYVTPTSAPITTSPAPKPAASPTVAITPKPAAVEPTVKSAPITESASANLISGTPRTVKPETTEPAGLTAAEVQAMLDKQEARFQARQEAETQRRIQELVDAQRASQLAALESAQTRALTGLDTTKTGKQTALDTAKNNYLTNLDTSLQSSMENIGNEEAKIDPYYYDLRNQAQASSDVGAMNFAQYMAGRGIKGGAGAMPEIYRNAGLQGQIGGLNRQQAANQSEIERMRTTTQGQYDTNRTNVLNNYETDLAGLESEYLTNKQGMLDAYDQDRLATRSGLDAKGLQAFIDQMNADRLFSLNEAGITGKYGGKPTLAGQEFQQKLDDTAKQSWLDTRDRFSDNYQQEINNLQNDNDTTNDWRIPYLESDRQGKIQKEAEQTAAQATAASEAERTAYLDALNAWKISGTANEQMASILGVPVGARTADYDIDKINAATSAQNANTAAKNANTAQTKTETPKPDDSYSGYMSKAIGLMNSDSSPEQIIAYIKSLPISAEQKAQMANDLGL